MLFLIRTSPACGSDYPPCGANRWPKPAARPGMIAALQASSVARGRPNASPGALLMF